MIAEVLLHSIPMYRHCLFCSHEFPGNDVVESFPVGRRLAFDSDKGRLWVVCRRCERWNLTPLEERWEAVEDLERTFRELRTRVSTDNVGMARHPSGLDLIRIGAPVRSEFAAWRYGDQFGRRRTRYLWYSAAGAVALGGVVLGGLATGAISAAVMGQSWNVVHGWQQGRTRVKFRDARGRKHRLRLPELNRIRLVDKDGLLKLETWDRGLKNRFVHEGEEARRLAGIIMPAFNAAGAKRDTVQDAVRRIEDQGHPERFIRRAIDESEDGSDKERRSIAKANQRRKRKGLEPFPETGFLKNLTAPSRLALEMALHEEQERRALEGELKSLEIAWRQAEELAAIEDELLLPVDSDARLEELKAQVGDTGATHG